MSFDTGPRRVSEAGALRALSHPLRLRLLELLERLGPLTATQASAQLATTPSNCSFHLRVLARHGYVTDAGAEVSAGRQRPWRLVDANLRVAVDELDAHGRDALRVLLAAVADQHRQRVFRWLDVRDDNPTEWRDAAGESHHVLNVTAAELRSVRDAVRDVVEPYLSRPDAGDPAARPVAILFSALPLVEPDAPTPRSPATGT